MKSINEQEILFDDFSILEKLVGHKQLNLTLRTNDCDCIGYTAPLSDDNLDTNQVTQFAGQAN